MIFLKQTKILIAIVSVVALFSCKGDAKKQELSLTTIEIINPIYDFEEIPLKIEANGSFNIINTGNEPLIIYDVKTSCGCTVPKWTKGEIKKGEQVSIGVTYDAKYEGPFRKTVSVFYNGKNSPKKLVIQGEVVMSK